MDYQLFFFILSAISAMLVVIILHLNNKIKTLRKLIEEERKKRTFPLLVFRVDTEEIKAYLKNESYCYAKHVVIEDLDLTVEYGFKKRLLLRFDPINMLKPNQEVKLDFRVFDNDFDVTTQSPDSLVLQFHDTPFTMFLRYENLENEHFRSTVVWDKNEYVVKEVKPLDEVPTP